MNTNPASTSRFTTLPRKAVNVLIQTLLAASGSPPADLCRGLLTTLLQALEDAKPKVQQVALEAIAVLHESMGGAAAGRSHGLRPQPRASPEPRRLGPPPPR